MEILPEMLAAIAVFLVATIIGLWYRRLLDSRALMKLGEKKPSAQPPEVSSRPMQLPSDLLNFVGREEYISEIASIVESDRAPIIISASGMGGIGKTTLTIRLAHLLRDNFPDGVLWARVDASDIMTILAGFAQSYGLDVSHLTDIESRGAAVRSLLARKQALVILDNVESSDQVIPVIPGTGKSVVLMTTRRRDLATLKGWHSVEVDRFTTSEAISLLSRILGNSRVENELESAIELVELLGNLPLAVSLAAGHLASAPGLSISGYIGLLEDEQRQLNVLQDEHNSVRASLGISYQQLEASLQCLFTTLAVFPGPDFSASAVSAALNRPEELVKFELGRLANLSLVQEGGQGRYSLHPLLRAFAIEQLSTEMEQKAQEGLSGYFLRFSQENQNYESFDTLEQDRENILSAMDWAYINERWQMLLEYCMALIGPEMKGFLPVRGHWSETKKQLGRAIEASQRLGKEDLEALLQRHLGRILTEQGDYQTAKGYLERSLHIADKRNDIKGGAQTLVELARIYARQGDYDQARKHIQLSLDTFQRLVDYEGLSDALHEMGFVHAEQGEFEKAREYYESSLSIKEELGDALGQARLLHELGRIAADQGSYEVAEGYLQKSLATNESIGDQAGLAATLHRLGMLSMSKGDLQAADKYYQRSLKINEDLSDRRGIAFATQALGGVAYRHRQFDKAREYIEQSRQFNEELGDRRGLAANYKNLGDVAAAQADYIIALEWYKRSLEINMELGNKLGLAIATKAIGDIAFRRGDYEEAKRHYKDSLRLNEEIGSVQGRAYVLNTMGELAEMEGNIKQAISYWEESLTVFEQLGSFMAERVRRRLSKYQTSDDTRYQ